MKKPVDPNKDFNAKAHKWFVGICLAVFLSFTVTLGYVLKKDLEFVPIKDVYTEITSATPGGVANIPFTYTREETPTKLEVTSRELVCEDGTFWKVEAPLTNNTVWPNGVAQKATLPVLIPDGVEPGQNCYYSSPVLYYRTLLPPILMKIPPAPAAIFIEYAGN